jgi:hypothetical protein
MLSATTFATSNNKKNEKKRDLEQLILQNEETEETSSRVNSVHFTDALSSIIPVNKKTKHSVHFTDELSSIIPVNKKKTKQDFSSDEEATMAAEDSKEDSSDANKIQENSWMLVSSPPSEETSSPPDTANIVSPTSTYTASPSSLKNSGDWWVDQPPSIASATSKSAHPQQDSRTEFSLRSWDTTPSYYPNPFASSSTAEADKDEVEPQEQGEEEPSYFPQEEQDNALSMREEAIHREDGEEAIVHKIEQEAIATTISAIWLHLFHLGLVGAVIYLAVLPSLEWIAARASSTSSVVDFYFTEDHHRMCPMVSAGSQWSGRLLDPAFYYSLDHLIRITAGTTQTTLFAGACRAEESIWKLWVTDLWVRGVWTRTDSWSLLLVNQLPSAMMALLLGRALVVPLVAIVYAMVATVVVGGIEMTTGFVMKLLGILVPLSLSSSPIHAMWNRGLLLVAHSLGLTFALVTLPFRTARGFCRWTIVGVLCLLDNDSHAHILPPSITGAHKRPTWSPAPSCFGGISRMTRLVGYFYRQAHQSVWEMFVTTLFTTMAARAVLLLNLPSRITTMMASSVCSISKYQDQLASFFFSLSAGEDEELSSSCRLSIINVLAPLKLFEWLGVPDIASQLSSTTSTMNSWDQHVLTQIQQENDYRDESLRRLVTVVKERHFETWPWFLRIAVVTLVVMVVFAGFVQQLWNLFDRLRYWRTQSSTTLTLVDHDGEMTTQELEDNHL